jgi:hypothetical protein
MSNGVQLEFDPANYIDKVPDLYDDTRNAVQTNIDIWNDVNNNPDLEIQTGDFGDIINRTDLRAELANPANSLTEFGKAVLDDILDADEYLDAASGVAEGLRSADGRAHIGSDAIEDAVNYIVNASENNAEAFSSDNRTDK